MANLKRAGSILLALSLAGGGVPVVSGKRQACSLLGGGLVSLAVRAPRPGGRPGRHREVVLCCRGLSGIHSRKVLALVQAAEAQSASGARGLRSGDAAGVRWGWRQALPVDTYAHATEA